MPEFSLPYRLIAGRSNKTDYIKLFTETEFENILVNRIGALEEANEYINIMIGQVEHIIKLINKDITE